MCLLQPPGSVALLLGQYKKKRHCSDTLVSTRNVFIVHLQKMGTRIDCCVARPLQSDDNVSAQKPNGKKKVERINKNGCNRHMIHVPSSNVVGWIMTSPWKNGRACLVLFSWMTHLSIICDTQTWHPLNCGFIVIVWGFWWGFFCQLLRHQKEEVRVETAPYSLENGGRDLQTRCRREMPQTD